MIFGFSWPRSKDWITDDQRSTDAPDYDQPRNLPSWQLSAPQSNANWSVYAPDVQGESWTDDTVVGTVGNDVMRGNFGDDTLTGGAGHDDLFGGTGKDHLYGSSGDDWLHGESGNDVLVGGASSGALALTGTPTYGTDNDVLDGGEGSDVMYGGAGADVFRFDSVLDFAARPDLIADFSRAEGDRVGFQHIDADATQPGDQAFRLVTEFKGAKGELRTWIEADQTYVAGDMNGDRAADFVVQLTGSHALVASDFIL